MLLGLVPERDAPDLRSPLDTARNSIRGGMKRAMLALSSASAPQHDPSSSKEQQLQKALNVLQSTFGADSNASQIGTVELCAVAFRIIVSLAGHSSFRLNQEEAVLAALAGRDCLTVMPTGVGF